MANYYFWYDPTTGQLWPASQAQAGVPVPSGWGIPLDAAEIAWDTTADPSAEVVWWHPDQYRVVSGTIVAAPYLTVEVVPVSGTSWLHVAVQGPIPPQLSGGSVLVADTVIDVPLSGGQGSLSFVVDANLLPVTIPVSVEAPGCVGVLTNLGMPQGPTVPLQVIAPGASGNPSPAAWRIATTSTDYLLEYYSAGIPAAHILNAILVMLQALVHTVYGDLLPQAMAQTWAPLPSSTNRDQAWTDIYDSVLPNLVTTLETIYPVSGTPMALYVAMKEILKSAQVAMHAAEYALNNTPNLQ